MSIATNKRIVVIGAGASGMVAAGRAAELGTGVTVLEKGDRACRKLLLTGNGRCNLTNSGPLEDFIFAYGASGSFLRNAFSRFFRSELLSLFEEYGVTTITEADGRIFPERGGAGSIAGALGHYHSGKPVQILFHKKAVKLQIEGGEIRGVYAGREYIPAPAVILAAGGASYPGTGSNGDGFEIARRAHHTVTKIRPALVPLILKEKQVISQLQGLSLYNIRLTSFRGSAEAVARLKLHREYGRGMGRGKPPGDVIESRIGDIIFTRSGISGPAALRMSLSIVDALAQGPVSVSIDLFPELVGEHLHDKLRDTFNRHGRRTLQTILSSLIPGTLASRIIEIAQVPADIRAAGITIDQENKIVTALKSLGFTVAGTLPLEDALITAGGISLKEIDPVTMMSRLVPGLFFCGEVMDIDADTGGYNLQAAFSTGYIAGESAAGYIRQRFK
jgi:hypothetical protein